LYNAGEDVPDFMSLFGLCCSGNFQVTINGPDPGDLGGGEEAEATLDSSWVKALAPGASVNLVVSATTNTTDGIDLSEVFIIENNFSDVMTESFSACELYATDSQLAGTTSLAKQAAAQGITYIVSAGDNGAAGCDDPSSAQASNPISVNLLASTAFNIAVGGTMFNESGQASKYWTSTPPISETAISYIPENVWNESGVTTGLWSGSGGASAGNIQSGGLTPGVPKPSWQSQVQGIPTDGVRDLPDISLTAASHDPYLLCLKGSCLPDSLGRISVYFVSGTSAAAPSFAGVMALVDQQISGTSNQGPRQGQANYVLYRLAASQNAYPSQCNGSSTSTAPANSCIFNDVTTGNNAVPGEVGTKYQAGAGYDLATGLGSVNVANLITNWNTITFTPTTTALTLNNGQPVSITHGQSVPLQATVAAGSGTGVPTGNVVVLTNTLGLNSSTMETFPLNGGQVISSISQLQGSGSGTSYSLWARYAGDATFAPSSSNLVSITVAPEPSTTTVSVLTFDPTGTQLNFPGGPFGSFVYLRGDVAGKSGIGIPTGSVSFLDGGNPIAAVGSLPLNGEGNTATPNGTFNFDAGTHTISAAYSGDGSFNASTSSPTITFTITPGFFASIPASASQVLISAPGSTGISSVTVSNSTNFNGNITLACAGLPSEATCAFTPATISATGTPNTTTVSIVVATKAATAKLNSSRPLYLPAQWMMGMGLLLFIAPLRGKQGHARLLRLLFAVILVASLPSCGGGGGSRTPPPDPGTPIGASRVTVTASSGSTMSATGFTLFVN
jgi:hypothetical protein